VCPRCPAAVPRCAHRDAAGARHQRRPGQARQHRHRADHQPPGPVPGRADVGPGLLHRQRGEHLERSVAAIAVIPRIKDKIARAQSPSLNDSCPLFNRGFIRDVRQLLRLAVSLFWPDPTIETSSGLEPAIANVEIFCRIIFVADMQVSFWQVMKVVKDLLVTQTAGTQRIKPQPSNLTTAHQSLLLAAPDEGLPEAHAALPASCG